MKEYTLVGPTNRYTAARRALLKITESGLLDGTSAQRRGRGWRPGTTAHASESSEFFPSVTSLALCTVASILARLRIIPLFPRSSSTSFRSHPGDFFGFETLERFPERIPLVEHGQPAEAGLKHAESQRLEQGSRTVGRSRPFDVVIPGKRGVVFPDPFAALELGGAEDDEAVTGGRSAAGMSRH